MKATLAFAVIVVLVLLVLGGVLAIPFSGAAERRAIEASAVVALVVQCLAFAIARLAAAPHFIAGWVGGVALRFAALLAYAVVGVRMLGMPAPAALISLVCFLFISTLVEPPLLTR